MNNLDLLIDCCIEKDLPLFFLDYLQKKQDKYSFNE